MAEKFKAESFKKILFDDMYDYINENHPEDKAWFKEIAFQDKEGNKVGKYNHLNAKMQFCKKYAPELIPVAKEKKVPVTKKLENW